MTTSSSMELITKPKNKRRFKRMLEDMGIEAEIEKTSDGYQIEANSEDDVVMNKLADMMNSGLKLEFTDETEGSLAKAYGKHDDTTDRTKLNLDIINQVKNATFNDLNGLAPQCDYKDILVHEIAEAYYMQTLGFDFGTAHKMAVEFQNVWRNLNGKVSIKSSNGAYGNYIIEYIDGTRDRIDAEDSEITRLK